MRWMVNRLVSGGGAGRLLDEVGEGSGLEDHRPDSSREASRVSAEWAPEILAAQAEWRTWLLRGPSARCLPRGLEATTQRRRRAGCLHARLGARSVTRPVRRRPPLSQGELAA